MDGAREDARVAPSASDAARRTDPDSRHGLTIKRIVRVNHAGEYGAIRIYGAQIALARRLYPDMLAFLEETRAHEIRHCELFSRLMPARGSRPCRAMWLWSKGGFVLGALSALFGRQGVWICTAAVESAVHQHLQDQLHFLEAKDSELRAGILDILDEELAHLHEAETHLGPLNFFWRSMRSAIYAATDALIWLSTWGDSARMARDLAQARSAATF